jgi:hypothetical protein
MAGDFQFRRENASGFRFGDEEGSVSFAAEGDA